MPPQELLTCLKARDTSVVVVVARGSTSTCCVTDLQILSQDLFLLGDPQSERCCPDWTVPDETVQNWGWGSDESNTGQKTLSSSPVDSDVSRLRPSCWEVASGVNLGLMQFGVELRHAQSCKGPKQSRCLPKRAKPEHAS